MPLHQLHRRATALAPALAVAAVCCGQGPELPETAYERVKLFDFDEQSEHFNAEPMHWTRLRGPGLPVHVFGGFDPDVGHRGPPSFRLDARLGSTAYRYEHLDLMLAPESDYLVTGWVRTRGLDAATAFISTYLIDRFKERIPGSEEVSQLVQGDSDWREVRIPIPAEHAAAWALRIECWVLQDYAWREAPVDAVDPIVRADSAGSAWFDDIEVFRLPRTTLRFSNPSGLVHPGEPGTIIIEANNATSANLVGELAITDGAGRVRDRREIRVPGLGTLGPAMAQGGGDGARVVLTGRRTSAVQIPTPELEPGVYTATLRLDSSNGTLVERTLRFAVLADLAPAATNDDMGVQLGRWPGADIDGVIGLLEELGVGAAKVGVALSATPRGGPASPYYAELVELVRRMGVARVHATGVLITEETDGRPVRFERYIRMNEDWHALLRPLFAHFGGLVPNWQLGLEHDAAESTAPLTRAEVGLARTTLQRFVTLPELVVPQSVLDGPRSVGAIPVYVAPPEVPTRDLPATFAFLGDLPGQRAWVHLDHRPRAEATPEELGELARRITLLKALGAERLYLPAPFEPAALDEGRAWQPNPEYLVVRTLTRYLAGRQPVAVMYPHDDLIAILFEGGGSSCIVIWSWRAAETPVDVELFLGSRPRVRELDGREVEFVHEGLRSIVPVTRAPRIVEGLHLPLALLQASFEVTPTYLEGHRLDPGPTITFRNPYPRPLSARLKLAAPPDWQLEPTELDVVLGPHESFSRALRVKLPTREVAGGHVLDATLTLHAPEPGEMRFPVRLTLGLRDIDLIATPFWRGDTLLIEQVLRNLSDAPVRFNTYCAARGRRRLEGVFLDVLPGETAVQVYELPEADDLRGGQVDVGVSEIRGQRRLDQVVRIPG